MLCRSLFFMFIVGGMGKAFFARGGLKNNTGKSSDAHRDQEVAPFSGPRP